MAKKSTKPRQKKVKKKLIDAYKQWMESGEMTPIGDDDSLYLGLCNAVLYNENITGYNRIFFMIQPTLDESVNLSNERYSRLMWGCGMHLYCKEPKSKKGKKLSYKEYEKERSYGFTDLRQTIVCLIMAIKGEI